MKGTLKRNLHQMVVGKPFSAVDSAPIMLKFLYFFCLFCAQKQDAAAVKRCSQQRHSSGIRGLFVFFFLSFCKFLPKQLTDTDPKHF